MDTLVGKVAIITGAASGIGRASAVALASRGARIVVADIDGAGAASAAAAIGKQAVAVCCDVSDEKCFELLKVRALDHFGSIDIIMNNAGTISRGLPEQIPLIEWRRILDINLLSVVRSNLVFLPHLMAQRSGHIINTASFAGLFTYSFDRQPYAAAKAAVVQISEGLAIYLKPFGVGITLLCPGPVATNIAANVPSFGEPTDTLGPGAEFKMLAPEEVGEQVAGAILAGRFLLPTHPQVVGLLRRRAAAWDDFLADQIAHPHIVRRTATDTAANVNIAMPQ
jgi:NAD(P)-dependent dehydrogenase (short-subunit alcohol dehydrogenase family)